MVILLAGAEPQPTAQEPVKEAGNKGKKKKGEAGAEEEDLDALLAEFGVNAEAAAGQTLPALNLHDPTPFGGSR